MLIYSTSRPVKRRPTHHESKLQIDCVELFRYQFPIFSKVFFAVPNGGRRNPREAGIMKAEGVTSGVSDLILLVPMKGFHGLCLETKFGDNGLSKDQREFKTQVEFHGFKHVTFWSKQEFILAVCEYLGIADPDQAKPRPSVVRPFCRTIPSK